MADYPAHLARRHRLQDGRTVWVRPVREEDELAEREFFERLSTDTLHLRFMSYVGSVNAGLIRFFTHIDYRSHMAFVCEAHGGERPMLVGDARYVANPDARSCEFGIVVADGWHGSGIGWLLMDALVRAARARGFETMEGLVLRENAEMLKFVDSLGFEALPEADAAAGGDAATVRVRKRL